MDTQEPTDRNTPSRREFLRVSSGVLAGTTTFGHALAATPHREPDDTLKIALVGCGGRGGGAAVNALSTEGPTRLVAMADVFSERLGACLTALTGDFSGQVDVPEERKFVGMDAHRNAIDAVAPGGVVILATPPAFRPIHLEYAVAQRCHVFMEKSFAVDAPGVRRVLAAGQEAERRNLKIAGGLMSRHYAPLQETIARIHDGAIGELIHAKAFRMHGPVPYKPRVAGSSELAFQIQNYSCFTWLNGSFLLDWLIHNLDVCCWAKDAWPVSAQGQGGRQRRTEPDQLFDHYDVQYAYPDGTILSAQGRHMVGCWNWWGGVLHGTKGSAVLGEGVPQPQLFKGHRRSAESLLWEPDGPHPNPYQVEHDRLFKAIRKNQPYNETERCAFAAMTGILGRMAIESGKEITWGEALASDLELAPGLDDYTMESAPPVLPDEHGRYPVAMPGLTSAL